MGTTPAAELARVKVQHPGWSIQGSNGSRFVARRWLGDGRVQQVRAPTLTALEHALWLREKFRNLHDGAA
jgi:hypothetical protein